MGADERWGGFETFGRGFRGHFEEGPEHGNSGVFLREGGGGAKDGGLEMFAREALGGFEG